MGCRGCEVGCKAANRAQGARVGIQIEQECPRFGLPGCRSRGDLNIDGLRVRIISLRILHAEGDCMWSRLEDIGRQRCVGRRSERCAPAVKRPGVVRDLGCDIDVTPYPDQAHRLTTHHTARRRGDNRGDWAHCRRWPEDLDTLIDRIGDIDSAYPIDRQPSWIIKQAIAAAETAPAGQPAPGVAKLLHPAIARIGDINLAIAIDRDPPWIIELSVPRPLAAPTRDVDPGICELDDAAIPRICDIDIPQRIDGDSLRTFERTTPTLGSIPTRQEIPVFAKLLDAMVATIRNVDVADPIDGHLLREVKLPVVRAAPAPTADVAPSIGELLDTMIAGVGDIDIPTGVERHALRVEQSVVPAIAVPCCEPRPGAAEFLSLI